jgi:hypothetical protein
MNIGCWIISFFASFADRFFFRIFSLPFFATIGARLPPRAQRRDKQKGATQIRAAPLCCGLFSFVSSADAALRKN